MNESAGAGFVVYVSAVSARPSHDGEGRGYSHPRECTLFGWRAHGGLHRAPRRRRDLCALARVKQEESACRMVHEKIASIVQEAAGAA